MQHKIKIYSDHFNLQYFISTLRSYRRQAGCIQKFIYYGFGIFYFLGSKNSAGAPSRRPEYMTKSQETQIQRNLKLAPGNDLAVNAIVDLKYKNITAQALYEN